MPLNINHSSLAINGGSKIRTKPWLDNFLFGKEEKEALNKVIDSGYLSKFEGNWNADPPFSFLGGPVVQELEKLWCEKYNIKHSVSVNSATSGLFASIGALNIGYGDEVIVSPGTMTACAMAPLTYGAIPIFADVSRKNGNIDPVFFEKAITKRTKAIVIVHTYGIPADMDSIMKIAKKNNIKVIEDCAQAHGTLYKGKPVGTFGDIGVFSLNVNKQINCGEGGVCVTNNDELCLRLRLIRNHGETSTEGSKVKDITNIAGYNYRLTELQAAVAIEQLKKLTELNRIRIEYCEYLNENLKRLPFLETVEGEKDCVSTFYQWPIIFKKEVLGLNALEIQKILNAEGMYFIRACKPLYFQPVYQKKNLFKLNYPFSAEPNKDIKPNYERGSCKVVEELYDTLLIKEYIRYPTTWNDVKDVVKVFDKINNAL